MDEFDPVAANDAAWNARHTSSNPQSGNGVDSGGGLPTVEVRAGLRHEAADAGLAVLRDARVAFYQRDRSLVRVCMIEAKTAAGEITSAPGIIPVSRALLGRELGRAAQWTRFDKDGRLVR
jgi:hypothetical protein